jgi:hypothetical protein
MASQRARPEWKIRATMANAARMTSGQVDARLGAGVIQTIAA